LRLFSFTASSPFHRHYAESFRQADIFSWLSPAMFSSIFFSSSRERYIFSVTFSSFRDILYFRRFAEFSDEFSSSLSFFRCFSSDVFSFAACFHFRVSGRLSRLAFHCFHFRLAAAYFFFLSRFIDFHFFHFIFAS
jgi:hypothetical protein